MPSKYKHTHQGNPGEEGNKEAEKISEETMAEIPKFNERSESTQLKSSTNSKQDKLKVTLLWLL